MIDETEKDEMALLVKVFVRNLIIYDPLNRPINGYKDDKELDLSTNRDDLKDIITTKLKFIESTHLNSILTPELLFKLNNLFDIQTKKVNSTIEKWLECCIEISEDDLGNN